MKRIFYTLIVSSILMSCTTTKPITDQANEGKIEVNDNAKDVIKLTASIGTASESDFIVIKSASISGDIMLVTVEYSGGCEDHSFEMIGEMAIMKSLPPKRTVTLVHNANGDSCRELITKTLEIDISALAADENSGSEIILLLGGHETELSYIKA